MQSPSLDLFDPNTWPGSVATQAAAAVVAVVLLAVLSWVLGPVRWLYRGRQLRKLLKPGRPFHFVYNADSSAAKTVTFLPGGDIGAGKNSNEHGWRVRRGLLEFTAADGRFYSRFKLNQASGRLENTNDPHARSTFGQYIVPQYQPWEAATTDERLIPAPGPTHGAVRDSETYEYTGIACFKCQRPAVVGNTCTNCGAVSDDQ